MRPRPHETPPRGRRRARAARSAGVRRPRSRPCTRCIASVSSRCVCSDSSRSRRAIRLSSSWSARRRSAACTSSSLRTRPRASSSVRVELGAQPRHPRPLLLALGREPLCVGGESQLDLAQYLLLPLLELRDPHLGRLGDAIEILRPPCEPLLDLRPGPGSACRREPPSRRAPTAATSVRRSSAICRSCSSSSERESARARASVSSSSLRECDLLSLDDGEEVRLRLGEPSVHRPDPASTRDAGGGPRRRRACRRSARPRRRRATGRGARRTRPRHRRSRRLRERRWPRGRMSGRAEAQQQRARTRRARCPLRR